MTQIENTIQAGSQLLSQFLYTLFRQWADLRLENNEFIVVVDDLFRENEGDRIIAAEDMATEKTAVMVR